MKKSANGNDEPNRAHDDRNQGKSVVTGFHGETSESEVEQLLRETITEIGMSIENARIERLAKPITHAFMYFKNDDERTNMSDQRTCREKSWEGQKIKITRSMDVEERCHQKRMECVKYCIHMRDGIHLNSISLNWTSKYVSVKGQNVVKTCQSGSLKYIKYQDIESEVEEQMESGNQKKLITKTVSSREMGHRRRGRRKDYE